MSCKRSRDCNGKNQRCQTYPEPVAKPFCGTNKCRRKRDCKDVGNRANGQNKARLCIRGRCLYNMDMEFSMTQLLTHAVAHSTRPSFRPKINNQPTKKFLSLEIT